MIENLGKDFAIEWRERHNVEFKRNLDLGNALCDMFFCFRCLTTGGGWDTMTELEKQKMITYRDEARRTWLGKDQK